MMPQRPAWPGDSCIWSTENYTSESRRRFRRPFIAAHSIELDMVKFLPYILKTLWRHRSRTLLTVSGSAVALFVFCFVGSVQQGMNDLQQRQEAKQSLVMFQANKFCPATSHLPQDYESKIMALDGIREVVPIQVFTNNCRA